MKEVDKEDHVFTQLLGIYVNGDEIMRLKKKKNSPSTFIYIYTYKKVIKEY